MNKYAVAYVSLFDNDLKIKIVEAPSWREALAASFSISLLTSICGEENLEDAKEVAFNQDWLFDVKVIK